MAGQSGPIRNPPAERSPALVGMLSACLPPESLKRKSFRALEPVVNDRKRANKARLAEKRAKRRKKYQQQDAAKLTAAGMAPLGKPHPDYKREEAFYKSSSWRTLRYLALRNCNGCCQCCGAPGNEVRLHVDHIIPRYKAPHLSLDINNLQVLCEDCNIGKGAHDSSDWRRHFRSI
jgi:5-methylcytosine-specific restriction endonuclease McrA